MGFIKGTGDFFALDIGTNAIRVVQLHADGQDKWSLVSHAYVPVDSKITSSDSAEARRRLGERDRAAVSEADAAPLHLQQEVERLGGMTRRGETEMAKPASKTNFVLFDVIWPAEYAENNVLVDVTDRITPEMQSGVLPGASRRRQRK